MTLVYGSDLDERVGKHIRGNVARVGGSVNQLLQYGDKLKVQDINVIDGGFGSIKNITEGSSVNEFLKISARRLKQEIKYRLKGNSVSLDRKTIRLDMHFASERIDLEHKFDASISSNVLEHSPNIIFLLLNFHFITKQDGWMFHAIPNHEYTFDRFREPTELAHFVADFENYMSFEDMSHNEDYVQSAIIKDGWQKEFHQKYPVQYPFMHFHVFNKTNTEELFRHVFEEVHCDLLTDSQFSDNVVLCRNNLNPEFVKRYAFLIEKVKNGSYLSL